MTKRYIFIALLLLVRLSGAAQVDAPSSINITYRSIYQREAKVTWNNGAGASRVQVEVTNLDTHKQHVLGQTSGSEYYIVGLKPGTRYNFQIKVTSLLQNGELSDKSQTFTKSFTTLNMSKGEDDLQRVPYLRTVRPDGPTFPRTLSMFWNEVATPDAEIIYALDGKPIQPVDNQISFPRDDDQHFLDVTIDEKKPGRIWHVRYTFTVSKEGYDTPEYTDNSDIYELQ